MVGLIIDGPEEDDQAAGRALALYDDVIEETGWGRRADEGWQVVSAAEVSDHGDRVENLYSRDTEAD